MKKLENDYNFNYLKYLEKAVKEEKISNKSVQQENIKLLLKEMNRFRI